MFTNSKTQATYESCSLPAGLAAATNSVIRSCLACEKHFQENSCYQQWHTASSFSSFLCLPILTLRFISPLLSGCSLSLIPTEIHLFLYNSCPHFPRRQCLSKLKPHPKVLWPMIVSYRNDLFPVSCWLGLLFWSVCVFFWGRGNPFSVGLVDQLFHPASNQVDRVEKAFE